MTEFRKLSSEERQERAKAIAQSYLDQAHDDKGVGLNSEIIGKVLGEPPSPERQKYLEKMADRFAKGMETRLLDIDSPFTREELRFAFLEMFNQVHMMKPLEVIAMFKTIGEWCGFSNIPVRALKMPQGRFPVLKFTKVGS